MWLSQATEQGVLIQHLLSYRLPKRLNHTFQFITCEIRKFFLFHLINSLKYFKTNLKCVHKSIGQTGSDGNNPSTAPTHLHPAPSRKQHSALKAKALEGEGPFSNHCRSFDTHMKVSKCFE